MEKLRDTALACYDGFSDEQKDKAYAIFEAMDSNGDGTVSLKEYEEFFGSSNRTFFEELDTDGNGKLDFEEFITLFYILLSSRAETATSPLVKTLDQQKSSDSNEVLSGSRSGRTRTEAVQSAVHKFNTAWTFGSAVGAVATSTGLCSIM